MGKLWVASFYLKEGVERDPCEIPVQDGVIGIWTTPTSIQQMIKVAVSAEDPYAAWDVINECFPDRDFGNTPGFSSVLVLSPGIFPPDRPWVAERMKKAQEAIASAARQADKALQD